MELYFNTKLCKMTSLTTALLAEYIRDICELEGKKKVVITGEEFHESLGIKASTVSSSLRKVRAEGLIEYKYSVKSDEFTIKMVKKPRKADNYLLKFPIRSQFSPKRMLILTILQESGLWMNAVEIGLASDGIFSKDSASMALNDMHQKGELLKRDATKMKKRKRYKRKANRVQNSRGDEMSNCIWFSSEVAQETGSIHAAILLERFHQRAKVEGNEITVSYKDDILPDVPDYMDNCIHFKNTAKKLHNCGYGVFAKGAGNYRKPKFKLTSERIVPDNNMRLEYLSNKCIKKRYIHNLLVDLFPVEIELHESALVRLLEEESQDIVSEQGIRVALRGLIKDGYLTFEKGNSKGVVYKDLIGYKVFKSVRGISS